jgi:peptidyl-prolyl cis-trans isomerase SurA
MYDRAMLPLLHRFFVRDRNVTFLRLAKTGLVAFGMTSLIVLATATSRPASAQDAGIAAIVNDEVISQADVENRVNLVTASSNIPDTPDIRAKLQEQVLHQLIDEKLELQEAKKEGVSVSDDEVNHAFDDLGKQNHMPDGGLDKFLQQHHIDKSTLLDQLRAEIVWGRVVRERYAPQLTVSDSDIDDAIQQIEQHDKEPQNRVAEIYLPVDNPSQDAEVQAAANRLTDAIKHGARFIDVARQFSRSPSAADGGDLGWLAPGMLPPDMQKIVDACRARTTPSSP